ncbi:MAG: hypothetical protein UV74_C0002G0066 [Candidatus Woesebacteria bacterium GW2011_GWB1_43_14]|uniref:Glycosyltransferase RgtA/B/C/D-like domain-containing protein n=1 Tax=Candidatus Woesebacteria bacterium GW2011_GWB1_43_14 TaxID=1618578 RepID=A0A0G1DLU7_9BACT|nr:MAG: hypothetical protein UV51_C0004G0015 [Candidatus Woesebacteria bacterium GW2011_GWC1_42_9]KKS98845.1 MAG: hypothetical protein UV74_C0002G0066 [Candidatus Woesebacteria bacterium GW2011_GWB1_43_14]
MFFAIIASIWLPLREGYINEISSWANFDGRHYITIATQGYDRFNFVFFPLYPGLIYLLHKIFSLNPVIAGLLISYLSFYAALVVFKKLGELDFKKSEVKWSMIFLALAPTAYYFQAVYTESLFLLLILLTFWFARKKSWLMVGVFGFLVCLTRHSGIALIPALIAEWFYQRKDSQEKRDYKIIPAIGLTILGTLSFMAYTKVFFGDFFLFKKSFAAWERDEIIFPLQTVYRYLKIFIFVNPRLLVYWIAVLEFISFLAAIILGLYTTLKIRVSYGILILTLLAMGSLSGTLIGTPRYLLHMFPIYWAITNMTATRNNLRYLYLGISIALGFILTSLFVRGYFVS